MVWGCTRTGVCQATLCQTDPEFHTTRVRYGAPAVKEPDGGCRNEHQLRMSKTAKDCY